MQTADIGLIGLAVMGENLALNIESKGYTVAVFNRIHSERESVVDRFIAGRGSGKRFIATRCIEDLMDAVSRPRKILLMVKAGEAVDEVLAQLMPRLEAGDVVIDGGNSDFRDTERRVKAMKKKGIHFIGAGISGGEEGALNGPSIMPGGSEEGWMRVKEILQAIAAKLDDGSPCCEWMGAGGAGHYVKMVHNGIEYGDMQLIAEVYAMLKRRSGLNNETIGNIFKEWNSGNLKSYLVEITSNILRFKDGKGDYVIDQILDVAGQKGTGRWSMESALEEGDPLTLVGEAVYARFISALLEERKKASRLYPLEETGGHLAETSLNEYGIEAIRDALYAAKLISYAQGFSLMQRASAHYGWNLNLEVIARIWQNGSIIRSAFLARISEAYRKEPLLENLLFDEFFHEKIHATLASLRGVVCDGVFNGIALPCISSALSYFDGLRTLYSSANLIQAQRDYFGAHTYERRDSERGEFFHTDWTGKGGTTVSGSYNA